MNPKVTEPDAGSRPRILITGGTGYLATSLVARLSNTDCSIVRLARPGSSFPRVPGQARVQDITGDLRNDAIWESALEDVDAVFHFAAQTSVSVAAKNPRTDFQANVMPMLHLLETCRLRQWRPDVLFSGTVTQAGIPGTIPVDETHPDHPVTAYDLHKQMAENYLKYYAGEGVVRGAVLRLANVYGPGPRSSSADRGILNQMIARALRGETLTIFGQGRQLRDYVYVEDVSRAFACAAGAMERLNGRHFVIGSGQGVAIADAVVLVAERVARRTGQKPEVVHVDPPEPPSPIDARNFIADSALFSGMTGWQPRVSLAEGIDRTIDSCLVEGSGRQ